MQKYFPRYAMAESAWLTRSLEQPHPFTLDFPGEIRNEGIKPAFLSILDDVEDNPESAEAYLVTLLNDLIQQHQNHVTTGFGVPKDTTVDEIITKLNAHFSSPRSSRLPVLALYAIYQCLMAQPRYQGKTLLLLKSHTTSDIKSHSLGDVEVKNKDGTPFEAVEIKHGKPITPQMVWLAYETKIMHTSVERYYFLSTHEPDFSGDVQEAIQHVRSKHGCEVIVNGVTPSLKYYLRLLVSPSQFLEAYTQALQDAFKLGGVQRHHLAAWQEL